MFFKDKEKELMRLAELHYIHGVVFPFPLPISYKALRKKLQKLRRNASIYKPTPIKPRQIKRHENIKPPKNYHIVSIWRQR